jgi:hypothetical protein
MKILVPFFVFFVPGLGAKLKSLFLPLFLFICLHGFAQAQESAGAISYKKTIAVSKTEVKVAWPVDFPNNNYGLYIRAWTENTVDGKVTQVQNSIYGLVKTASGFSVKVKNPEGYLNYCVTDTATMATDQAIIWSGTVKTVVPNELKDEN